MGARCLWACAVFITAPYLKVFGIRRHAVFGGAVFIGGSTVCTAAWYFNARGIEWRAVIICARYLYVRHI